MLLPGLFRCLGCFFGFLGLGCLGWVSDGFGSVCLDGFWVVLGAFRGFGMVLEYIFFWWGVAWRVSVGRGQFCRVFWEFCGVFGRLGFWRGAVGQSTCWKTGKSHLHLNAAGTLVIPLRPALVPQPAGS